jgi:hypothetical protein
MNDALGRGVEPVACSRRREAPVAGGGELATHAPDAASDFRDAGHPGAARAARGASAKCREPHGCAPAQRRPGETCAVVVEEGAQARRRPDRNAAPDSGKEEQGSCGQAGGKTDRAAEKSRIEA